MTIEDMLEQIWFAYPNDLCKGKKGGKKPALQALKKANLSEDEFKKVLLNIKAQSDADRKDPESYRWPFISTYINQARWDDWTPQEERKTSVKLCHCGQETMGSRFTTCIDHHKEEETPVLLELRQRYVDLGLKDKTPDECRQLYKKILERLAL